MFNSLIINVLQDLLFCIPKAAVLHGKSVGFASQKSRFRNVKAQLSLFNRIIFTKQSEKALTASLGDLLKNTYPNIRPSCKFGRIEQFWVLCPNGKCSGS
ncbi:hypothetical protein CTM63_05060 [Prevotella intermedia]|nr:hypothetical protein CTM63_05060 [Prevotella intermedia]